MASVLAQRFDAPMEVIVRDDCSPDGTWGVIKEFARQHPQLINAAQPKRNLGAARNFVETLRTCSGDYIALLEGDDVWTSPDKLSRQVALLESRPDAAFCFHRVAAVQRTSGEVQWEIPNAEHRAPEARLSSLVETNFIATCSVVFRRSCLPAFDEPAMRLKVLDWPLFLLLAAQGPGLFIDEEMGHYRLHSGGSHSAASTERRLSETAEALEWVWSRLPTNAMRSFSETVARHYYCRMLEMQKLGDTAAAWADLRRCFRTYWRSGHPWKLHLVRAAVSLFRKQLLKPLRRT